MKWFSPKNRILLQQFWAFARADIGKFRFSIVLMFLTLVFDLAKPFFLQSAIDVTQQGDLVALKRIALILLSLMVLEYITRCGFNFLLSVGFLNTITRIRQGVYERVMSLKPQFFEKEPVGKLLTRTISDAESLGETLRSGIATILVDFLTILGLLVIIFQLDLKLAPVLVITIPFVLITVRWAGSRLRKKYLEIRVHLAKANGFMAEGLNGVEILQLFQRQHDSFENYKVINRDYNRACITSNVYDASLYAIVDGIAALTTTAVIFWAFHEVLGPIEISSLVVFTTLIDKIYVPIRDLSGKLTVIQQAFAALDRIFELFQVGEVTPSGPQKIQAKALNLEFKDVAFQYSEEGQPVIQDINFKVSPGEVVALVGQTGSGKSTITKLLTKNYDGYQGDILINGVELTSLDTADLRSKIAVVHQDFHIFPNSLRENIRLFNPSINDDKIIDVIRSINAENWLDQLPGRLDFILQEDGTNISTGQRQLIVFVRALVHDAPVLIMDEATASVDSQTEAWIQSALEHILDSRTVLVIAHRLSTIRHADQILVLRDGLICERGSHADLMEQDGIYADLVNSAESEHVSAIG